MRRLKCPSCGERVRDTATALSHEELYDLAPDRFTQEELHELAQEQDEISLSTVRKRVHDMLDRGWVREKAYYWPKVYVKNGR